MHLPCSSAGISWFTSVPIFIIIGGCKGRFKKSKLCLLLCSDHKNFKKSLWGNRKRLKQKSPPVLHGSRFFCGGRVAVCSSRIACTWQMALQLDLRCLKEVSTWPHVVPFSTPSSELFASVVTMVIFNE